MIKIDRIMSSKDIEKLKERVDKDPNSKLFVPLAEEYRKEGLVEEAIKVLQDGLERQPGYMSARVALGKIYLEKGMPQEARGEFENVIKAIPDNLYAHKKLADIYRDSGKRDLAIKAYRTVLKLNAMDDDAINNLHELEVSAPEEDIGEEAESLEIHEEGSPGFGEAGEDEFVLTDSTSETGETPNAYTDDELSAFKDSLFREKGDETEQIVSVADETEEGPEEERGVETVSLGEDTAAEDRHAIPESHEGRTEDVEVMPMEDVATPDKGEIPAVPEAPEPVNVSAAPRGAGDRHENQSDNTLAAADGMIAKGDYAGAMNIYERILSANQGDRRVMQRVEELRSFLKMTGRDKDALLISRLNAFLEGVKKGRDGFLGRT